MRRAPRLIRFAAGALAGGLILVALPGAVQGAGAETDPVATRALVKRLAAAGRTQVEFVRRFHDVLRDEDVVMHGTLVLEPPDRARISFVETEERVTLRSDGGEWLQPRMEQMLRYEPARASAALQWWTLLVHGGAGAFHERPAGRRAYVLRVKDAAAPGDSARIELGDDGLPRVIQISEGAPGQVRYELQRWSFSKARGRSDFVLHAPPGFDVFDMP